MSRIEFRVDGAPVGKERPRRGRYGNFYTPDRTREYENRVRWAFADKYAGMEPWAGPVKIEVRAHVKSPVSTPDGSNILKAVEDALNGLAYKDDAQVVSALVVKRKAQNAKAQWISVSLEEVG